MININFNQVITVTIIRMIEIKYWTKKTIYSCFVVVIITITITITTFVFLAHSFISNTVILSPAL